MWIPMLALGTSVAPSWPTTVIVRLGSLKDHWFNDGPRMTTRVLADPGTPPSAAAPSASPPSAPPLDRGAVASMAGCEWQNGLWLGPEAGALSEQTYVPVGATYTVSLSVAQWPSRWNMQTPGPVPAHSESALQLRQACLSQTGLVGSAQSPLTTHSMHLFALVSQARAPAVVQSPFCRQPTQTPASTWHTCFV